MMSETQWPADRVERWPIERLAPYARNAREAGRSFAEMRAQRITDGTTTRQKAEADRAA